MVTDGFASYPPATRDHYGHERIVGAKRELPGVHRVASLCKRWLLGTHQGSVEPEHLQGYLNEFVFRFCRRTKRHRGLLFLRLLQLAVDHEPGRYRQLIANPEPKKTPPRPPTGHGHPPSVERPPANRPWRSDAAIRSLEPTSTQSDNPNVG